MALATFGTPKIFSVALAILLFITGHSIPKNMTLHEAARTGEMEIVYNMLIEAEENGTLDVNETLSRTNATPLHLAIQNNHIEIVDMLLEFGADPNALMVVDQYMEDEHPMDVEMAPIHMAARAGNHNLVHLLVDSGADPKMPDPTYNLTPLHYAVQGGDPECVYIMLAEGADPNATSDDGSPLHIAASSGNMEIVDLLLENGAKINGTWTDTIPLHWAALANDPAMIEYLVEAGSKLDKQDYSKRTPLHWAAADGNMEAAVTLLKLGADPKIKDTLDQTSAVAAEKAGYKDLATIIRDYEKTGELPEIPPKKEILD